MLYDVYVLTDKRNIDFIESFLEKFIDESWHPAADEYEIPRLSKPPERVFTEIKPLIQYCCANQRIAQAIYWTRTQSYKPKATMLFFTEDSHLVLGVSTNEKKNAESLLETLKRFADSPFGYIDFESPPELTAELFKSLASHNESI